MKTKITYLTLLFAFLLTAVAEATTPMSAETEILKHWKAGTTVSEKTVKSYGLERCFTKHTISDTLFKRIYGKSWKTDCTTPRSDLRYLQVLHRTDDGKTCLGEMVCHKSIADDLLAIFRELYDAHYQIERMVLIDNYDADDKKSMAANNTTCFNFRHVAGSKALSNHSRGKAVDLNPLYNPYVKHLKNGRLRVDPPQANRYADRSRHFKYKIDHNDLAYKIFTKHGFTWGGNWRSLKDYQHFEKK